MGGIGRTIRRGQVVSAIGIRQGNRWTDGAVRVRGGGGSVQYIYKAALGDDSGNGVSGERGGGGGG